MLKAMQIGMCSLDLAGSLRLYSALGFSNGGGQAFWDGLMRVQGLPPENHALVWFMVGAQSHVQLELFQYSQPLQRSLPQNWRPNDLGWTRLGIEVGDFDKCLGILASFGVALLTEPREDEDGRRVAFRDPFVGIVIELVESKPDRATPAILYAVASVSDLEGAREFYCDALQLPVESTALRPVEDEALWGLEGAEREGFLVQAGPIQIEVLRYSNPLGRPRRPDHRVSDQGIMNVLFATHEVAEMAATFDRLKALGLEPPALVRLEGLLAGYINDPEREVELAAFPPEMLPALGFESVGPFFGDSLNQSG